ncbi:uncharacterized protein KLLA0_B04455g [Kluyveromyces lactis]|uniref:KLLA0B04455p n=1 Tax=Kluyveromyces lactis (strain ATCC 8585 / CBS 2359 / DSM 70799 / NBRC 1267 / NRRL Y-1140 / WM37) TaxID=284590 RepID=Q6CWF8_KLULA|nr:uncharacterized protein KLLA0_B04455g [Kluyveromyces lactis]CAH02124.1 KLLA0B04455p [Kluyveromyces lactis]|eukprot:XP_451731.1 uncharacterized protein KLLA0_B04455g [Kluyveromyces lactis]
MDVGGTAAEQRQLLQKYANQIKILSEEITHYENEQSVKEWAIKDLNEKLNNLNEQIQTLRQDLRIETERCQSLEDANTELQSKYNKSEASRQEMMHELEQLNNEKRVISEKIRQSYIKLGTKRKIGDKLVPDNNSDDENHDDGPHHEEDDVVNAVNTITTISDFKGRKISSVSTRDASFDEWCGSESEAEENEDEIYDAEREVFIQQPLLTQYETLIQKLQGENEKMLRQLRGKMNNHRINYSWPLFVYETCPVAISTLKNFIRPSFLLLWQPWWSQFRTCSNHDVIETLPCINDVQ